MGAELDKGGRSVVPDGFVEDIWHAAGWASEFNSSNPCRATIISTPLAIYRNKSGSLVALDEFAEPELIPSFEKAGSDRRD